jgi:hypothetical protein
MTVLPCGLDAAPAASERFSSTTAPLLESPPYSSTCTPSGQIARTTRARCPVEKINSHNPYLALGLGSITITRVPHIGERMPLNCVLRYKSKYIRMIHDFTSDQNRGKMLKAMAKIYDPSYQ